MSHAQSGPFSASVCLCELILSRSSCSSCLPNITCFAELSNAVSLASCLQTRLWCTATRLGTLRARPCLIETGSAFLSKSFLFPLCRMSSSCSELPIRASFSSNHVPCVFYARVCLRQWVPKRQQWMEGRAITLF